MVRSRENIALDVLAKLFKALIERLGSLTPPDRVVFSRDVTLAQSPHTWFVTVSLPFRLKCSPHVLQSIQSGGGWDLQGSGRRRRAGCVSPQGTMAVLTNQNDQACEGHGW